MDVIAILSIKIVYTTNRDSVNYVNVKFYLIVGRKDFHVDSQATIVYTIVIYGDIYVKYGFCS